MLMNPHGGMDCNGYDSISFGLALPSRIGLSAQLLLIP
jgi:hypothetical protein